MFVMTNHLLDHGLGGALDRSCFQVDRGGVRSFFHTWHWPRRFLAWQVLRWNMSMELTADCLFAILIPLMKRESKQTTMFSRGLGERFSQHWSERPPKAPRAFGGAFVFSSRAGASLVFLQGGRSGNFPAGSACLSVCLFVCLSVRTLVSMGSRPINKQP
jgi:hypothetical protein